MLIEYVGHSCFYIVNKEGQRILTDPYDNTIGLKPVDKEADIVLVSHHHYDHDYVDGVKGNYKLFDKAGDYEFCDVKIHGVELDHDEADGSKRGKVIAFTIETDGMRIMHMGDVGAMPDDSFFENTGHIDILMIPIGGTYTVDAEGALDIMDRLNANINIPMHYKTTHLNLDIASPHEFIRLAKKEYDVSQLGGNTFEITPDSLKKRGRVIILENSY